MAVPGYVDDGNYTKAQQNGAPEITFPFQRYGDTKTFVAKVPMCVDVDSYIPQQPMTQRWFRNLGLAYLIDYEGPQEVRQRLMYYSLIFGNVPQTRIVYGSTTFAIQSRTNDPDGSNARISSIVSVYDAETVYEYSLKPLPQIFQSRLSVDASGEVVQVGDSSSVDSANRKLAFNTTSETYGGKIFQRMSVFALITNVKKLYAP